MPKNFPVAIIFSLLTLATCVLLVISLNTWLNLSSSAIVVILTLIWVFSYIFIMRAALPRLALSRGLVVFALSLLALPIQTGLFSIIGVGAVIDSPDTTAWFANQAPFWIRSISAMFWLSGGALTVAPILLVFTWAYATKGPDDT